MTHAASIRAQAKINLLLRVLAREASGYHSLETVFLRIDLADDVRVRIGDSRSLDCAGPELPAAGLGPTEANLAYRAALAYADATGWPRGFAIEIDKRIPVGGGLGGGSADAGAVLRALDALAPTPLGPRLVEIAAPLGADIPFMAVAAPMALAWGRGERMLALPPLASRPVVVVVPPFAVSTPTAYGWLTTSRNHYMPIGTAIPMESLASWDAMAEIAENDFEPVVAAHHPTIAALVRELRERDARIAMMSGSGSAVFGIFSDPPDVGALTRSTGCRVFATTTNSSVAPVLIEP